MQNEGGFAGHLLSMHEGLAWRGADGIVEALEPFGLRVTIEEGTDQGEDGPDDLSVPVRPDVIFRLTPSE